MWVRIIVFLLLCAVTLLGLDWSGPLWSSENHPKNFRYDNLGRLVESCQGGLHLSRFEYDRLDRLTQVAYFTRGWLTGWVYPATGGVIFEYDLAGNRTAMSDTLGRTSYEYDKLGRPSSRTTAWGTRLGYALDPWGRTVRLTLGGGKEIEYEYDLFDRVVALKSEGIHVGYDYTADGRKITRRLSNGVISVFEYDADGFLTAISHKDASGHILLAFHYRYDADGRVTRAEEVTPEGPAVTEYAYDAVGRLTRVVKPGGATTAYEYDSLGNRMAETGPGGRKEYLYDTEGRLLQTGDTILDYDSAGNVVSKRNGSGKTTYRYDHENRLIEVRSAHGRVRYAYDGEGNRVRREAGQQNTLYVQDVMGSVPQIVAARENGGSVTQYVFGPSRLARIGAGGAVHYLLEDRMGSTRALVNASGKIVARYNYSPFGSPEQVTGTVSETFLFGGEPWDEATGLIHLRARDYDPELGRFLSPDPLTGDIANPQSFNRYVYAQSDPVNNIDPTGLATNWLPPPPPPPPYYTDPNRRLYDLHHARYSRSSSSNNFRPSQATTRSWMSDTYQAGKNLWYGSGPNIVGLQNPKMPMVGPFFQAGGPFSQVIYHVFPPINTIAQHHDPMMDRYTGIFGTSKFMQDLSFMYYNVPLMPWAAVTGHYDWALGVTDRVGKAVFQTWREPFSGSSSFPLVGGVYLDQVAKVLGELGAIQGAMYDTASGRLVLVGDKQTSLPPMKPEYLAAAIRAVYSKSPYEPGMTIDPMPGNPYAHMMLVRFFANTEETLLGWVMFEADRVMKGYSVGRDNLSKELIQSSVPGYRSVTDMAREDGGRGPKLWSRFWLVPDPITAHVSEDGKTIVFNEIKMRVKTETMRWSGGKLVSAGGIKDSQAEAFAEHFSTNYDAYAQENAVYAELIQVTQAVALAKWMKQQGISVDWNFVRVFERPFDTPETTPAAYNEIRETILNNRGAAVGMRMFASFGGVDMKPEIVAEKSPAVSVLGADLARGLAEAEKQGQTSFTVAVDGEPRTAVVLPGPAQREAGSYRLVENDLPSLATELVGLPGLTRTYDSFHNSSSEFGRSWSRLIPRLEFETAGEKGASQYISVAGAGGKPVLLQRFTLTDDFGLSLARFNEHYIDNELGRIGFRPREMDIYRGIFPEGDGLYRLFFTNNDQAIFDDTGRLQVLFASGVKLLYEYDQDGRLAMIRYSREGEKSQIDISFEYDDQDRLVTMSNGDDRVAYAYDSDGNLSEVKAGGRTVAYAYDERGLLTRVDLQGKTMLENIYDPAGRLLSQRSFKGFEQEQKVANTADGGRIITVQKGGRILTSIYDRELRLLSSEDSAGVRHERSYTDDGQLKDINTTLPNNGRMHVEFYSGGNMKSLKDARGVRTEFHYYQGGPLAEVSVDGEKVESYSYDNQARLAAIDYPGGEREEFEYGHRGRPQLYRRIQNGISREIDLVKATSSEPETGISGSRPKVEPVNSGIVYRQASGAETFYAMNPQGLPASVRDPSGEITFYDYDEDNRLQQVRLPNGVSVHYEYDVEGRVISEVVRMH